MRTPFLKQADSMDCGPTCLAMVCRFYKKNIPVQSLREKAQIGKEGVNLLGISEAGESVGFRTQSLKLSFETIAQDAPLPAILHWDQNHFVVLYKVKKNKFLVADPGKGLITYNANEFKSHWVSDKSDEEEGIAIILQPGASFYQNNEESTPQKPSGLAFSNIFNYILPYKKLVLQLFIGLAAGSMLQLILPFLTQSVVDVGINSQNIHFIYVVLLAQMALFIGRLAIDFVRSWILLHISSRINISILTDFLIKLMKLPASFFDSKKTGDVLQRMNDHNRIESFLTSSSVNVLFSLVNLVVFSVVLLLFNPQIFIVFVVASIIYSAWVILFLKKRRQLDHRRFDVSSKGQAATIQLIHGMQEIKLNGAERPMRWNWEGLQARLFKIRMSGLALNQWQQTGAFFINEGKNIFITFLAAKAVIDGQMTLGTMLAVQYIIGQLNSPIEQAVGFLQSWQHAKISMERLNEIHSMEDEEPAHKLFRDELPTAFQRQLVGGRSSEAFTNTDDAPAAQSFVQELPPIPEQSFISFQNVSFTYPGAGNEAVLKDISLQIPKSKTTAIVGVSGSGKTTLLKLLLKFYECQKGDIKLGNTSLSNIGHRAWRSHCGAVMQESYIFSDTIARNIAVGVSNIDMDRLYHAVTVANVKDFVESLPLGFNTKIGSEGVGISMGQKQRLLIARAVYRDPEFIFFDEATNSLDANNETEILRNLQSFFKGKTVVVVAHRLSTVRHADQIIVLNKGAISEKGTHQELINLKGDYFKLVKNQLELGV